MYYINGEEILQQQVSLGYNLAAKLEALDELMLNHGRFDKLVDIHLTFVTLDEIHLLNKRARGKDEPTDVISFEPPFEQEPVGEVYVSAEYIKSSLMDHLGEQYIDVSIDKEILRLIIHGVLHVYGLDHEGHISYDGTHDGEEIYSLQEEFVEQLLA